MATTAKNMQIVAKVDRMMKGSEVSLNPNTYQRDLLFALNYYNANHDDKDKKKWLLHYVNKTDKKLALQLNKLDDRLFRHAGILARLLETGSVLEEKESKYFSTKLDELRDAVAQPVVPKKVEPTVNKLQERMLARAREMAGEFAGMIDDFIKEDKMFEPSKALQQYQITGPVAKLIIPMFDKSVVEFEEVLGGKDEQLNEAYSHLKKPKIKKLLALYHSIKEACGLQIQVAKATRAPQKRREKPAGKLVERMNYMKEFAEYGIKSIITTTIINSNELWVYNTKYKKLQVYRASDATGLSVKGTTIIGYDPSNSGSKTLRKPELVKGYQALGKRPLNTAYKALTTKESTVNGRVNEECILMKVF